MAIVLPDPGPPNLDFERPADRARLERTAAALRARGFKAQVADSAEQARDLVLEAVPKGAEVHTALSETLTELGIRSARLTVEGVQPLADRVVVTRLACRVIMIRLAQTLPDRPT